MMGGGGEVEGMGLGLMAALPLQLTPTVAISSGDHLGGSNNSSLLTNNGDGGLNNNLKKDDRFLNGDSMRPRNSLQSGLSLRRISLRKRGTRLCGSSFLQG